MVVGVFLSKGFDLLATATAKREVNVCTPAAGLKTNYTNFVSNLLALPSWHFTAGKPAAFGQPASSRVTVPSPWPRFYFGNCLLESQNAGSCCCLSSAC